MPIGYHVTGLPVTIVIHNAYATHNTMVTNDFLTNIKENSYRLPRY